MKTSNLVIGAVALGGLYLWSNSANAAEPTSTKPKPDGQNRLPQPIAPSPTPQQPSADDVQSAVSAGFKIAGDLWNTFGGLIVGAAKGGGGTGSWESGGQSGYGSPNDPYGFTWAS